MKRFLAALVGSALFTASVLFADSTGTNSIAGSLYRTVVNTNSGLYAVVDSNKEVVTLYGKTDHAIWTTNVVVGLQSAPVLSERKIHGMQMYQGDLWVNVGRGYGIVDIKTGDLKGFSQD
jgi:hypothetical protein